MTIRVSGEGPIDADIVTITECPAKTEVFEGRPLRGSAGQHYDRLLSLAELDRDDIRIENLSEVRAPGDKMSRMSKEDLAMWTEDLIRRINELYDPKILVPMGSYALAAITDRSGIASHRGTLLKPRKEIKHDCLVIPTYHPSNLHYHYELWAFIVADLIKVKYIANNDFKVELPTWEFIIQPTFEQTMETLEMLKKEKPEFVVLDVETPHNLLSCIGLAWTRRDAICIPFFNGNGRDYWTFSQEIEIWNVLGDVLPQLELAYQNAVFDMRILYEHNVHVQMPKWDSMLMHHCLYSEMPHTLDAITSVYTNLPFWKKDEDEEKGSTLKAGQEKKHWTYNCMDCIGTHWAIDELKAELEEEDMLSVYFDLYVEVLPAIFTMNMCGTPVDVKALDKIRKESNALIEQYTDRIEEETGHRVNANSPKQIADLFYNELGWARYRGEATAKKTLEKLAYKYQSDVPNLVVDIRVAKKMLGLFSEDNIIDGRVKTEYSLHRTNTGRFASRKGRGRGGMNLQNVKTGKQRRFFVPEIGHLMVAADQKQAEAMCVAWLADDDAMKSLIESGLSMHVEHGKRVYGSDFSKQHELYKVVKGLVHGGNYGLGWRRFALMTGLSAAEAKIHLSDYHNRYPGIRQNFHSFVEREIKKCRTLYNPFGRRQVFLGRFDNKTFQAGYAFFPQSTVSDINKKALKKISKHFIVLLETHDGLNLSVPESEVKYAAEALYEAYDVKFKIWDEEHTIPIDIEVGPNWEDMQELT